jgi:hypothetical protein
MSADSYLLQGLIKFKILPRHPLAEALNLFLNYNFDNYIFIKDDMKSWFEYIVLFNCNHKKCYKCNVVKYIEELRTCSACEKLLCWKCDSYDDSFCYDCLARCKCCGTVGNLLLQCHTCKEYVCNSFSNCPGIYETIIYRRHVEYFFCNKKCITVDFLRKLVVEELDRKFRRRALIKNLKMYNLKLRGDSKLCYNYINGLLEKPMTTEEVSQKMCEMKYLYDHCNMKIWLEEVYKSNYQLPVNNFEIAKQKALDYFGNYPIVWPWKTKVEEEHRQKIKKFLKNLT